jgi:hypothetical protein
MAVASNTPLSESTREFLTEWLLAFGSCPVESSLAVKLIAEVGYDRPEVLTIEIVPYDPEIRKIRYRIKPKFLQLYLNTTGNN